MSTSTSSIVVKAAVHIDGGYVHCSDQNSPGGFKLLGAREATGFDDDEHGMTVNGWTLAPGFVIRKGRRGDVYADEFQKESLRVYAVNESEYESVGEVDLTIFADSETDLQQFLADFKLTGTIEKDTTVQQTL